MKQKGNNMQMRKSLLIGMVITSLCAATGFIQPVWGQDRARAGRGGMLLRLILKHADLTTEQRDQVKTILADQGSRSNLQTLRSTLQEDRAALTDALLANTGDPTSLLQKVNNDQAAIAQARLDVILQVLNILTSDQRKKVAEIRSQLSVLHNQMRSVLSGSGQP